MRKIRVLIVDDAVVVRRIVSDVLASDPELEVAGTAATGSIALAKIPQVNPDLVTLDVEMPDMDGLQTLAALRKRHPMLPVIMFSTQTERGASATLDALALGASDYVTKPANVGGVNAATQRIREQLIPKIKLFCNRSAGRATTPAPGAASTAPVKMPVAPWDRSRRPLGGKRRVDIVAIGVSTGGPNALATVLTSIGHDLPVPMTIVQHMPPMFTRLLATRLAAQTGLSIAEGTTGARLDAGTIWVAPGDYHMSVLGGGQGNRLHVHQGPQENSCRPAVDVLFRSLAEFYGPNVLAVVLTGMGQDGLRGCEAIFNAGGQILAQDEATSVVWGMPGFVARANLADRVLPLSQVGPEIVRRVKLVPGLP